MSIQRKVDRQRRSRYYVTVELPTDGVTGRRIRKSIGAFGTKREASAAEAAARLAINQGRFVPPSRETVGEFLTQHWLPAVQGSVRPSTFASYESNIKAHVIPAIGAVTLQHLRPVHLNAMYLALRHNGRRDGNGGLSPRTIQLIHITLHRALKDALRWGHVTRNIADLADPPRQERPTMSVWDLEKVQAFLSFTRNDRLFPCFLLALTTGLRRGEILGLRWEDLDLTTQRAQIRQTYIVVNDRAEFSTPKTSRSRRSIFLDSSTVSVLREQRKRQLEDRLSAGGTYTESDLIFTSENGSPVHPQTLSDTFVRRVRAAGLPRIRFHDLRHTYASLALSAGVHPKIVSDRLGHGSISITLDTYSHVLPEIGDREAMRVAEMVTGKALPG